MKALLLRLFGFIPVKVYSQYSKTWLVCGAKPSTKPYSAYEAYPQLFNFLPVKSVVLHTDGTCTLYVSSIKINKGEFIKWKFYDESL